LENLIGKQDSWGDLRKLWVDAGANPPWAAFQKSYEVLDVSWFDDAYFETHADVLLRSLIEYVKAHLTEFIEP
jgi:hypothetical protein